MREDIGGRCRQVRKFRFQRLGSSATTEVTPSPTLIPIPTARRPSPILTPSCNLSHPRRLEEMGSPHQLSRLEKRARGQFPQRRRLHTNQFHHGRRQKGQYLRAEREKGRYHLEEKQRGRSHQRRRQDSRAQQQRPTGKMKDQQLHLKALLCVTITTGPYHLKDRLPATERRG